MTLKDLRLVRVHWDSDEGLISLTTGELLCYVASDYPYTFSAPLPLPAICLDGTEFDRAYQNDESWDGGPAHWGRVPAFVLAHPELLTLPGETGQAEPKKR